MLQHLEELLWELDALASIASGDVAEDVAYGSDRIGDRARKARRVLAVLFARCVPVAAGAGTASCAAASAKGWAGGFWEDEVTQEPAIYTR